MVFARSMNWCGVLVTVATIAGSLIATTTAEDESAKKTCVCKPTMKVEGSQFSCPQSGSLWMLDAAMSQISKQQAQLTSQEDKITAMHDIIKRQEKEMQNLKANFKALQKDTEKIISNMKPKKEKDRKEKKRDRKKDKEDQNASHQKRKSKDKKMDKKEKKKNKDSGKLKDEKHKKYEQKKDRKHEKDKENKRKQEEKNKDRKKRENKRPHNSMRNNEKNKEKEKKQNESQTKKNKNENIKMRQQETCNKDHKTDCTINKKKQDQKATYAKDCADIQRHELKQFAIAGIFRVQPVTSEKQFKVLCDFETDGGGWTVFQRRVNDQEDFYKDWKAYRRGFGNLTTNFWLGNKKLHLLTSQRMYELRVDMTDFRGRTAYARYATFAVDDQEKKYTMHLGKYTGTAGDSLAHHDGRAFSTFDRDHDQSVSGNCAEENRGGWWYGRCYSANLNGRYTNKHRLDGVVWHEWHNNHAPLQTVQMKIRPIGFKSLH